VSVTELVLLKVDGSKTKVVLEMMGNASRLAKTSIGTSKDGLCGVMMREAMAI